MATVEIATFPVGTTFYVDGVEVTGTVNGDWLSLPGSNGAQVSFVPPEHYSGSFTVNARGTVVDTTTSGTSVPAIVRVNPAPTAASTCGD